MEKNEIKAAAPAPAYKPKYVEGLNVQGRWNVHFVSLEDGMTKAIIKAKGTAQSKQSAPMASRQELDAWIDSKINRSLF